MTKPDDVSQEDWDTAYEVFNVKNMTPGDIARAIMAARLQEREDCAKVADELPTSLADEWLNLDHVRERHAHSIAQAIRTRK